MRPERQGKNKMNIRPAEKADMPALCALYAEGRRFMAAHGNAAQWRGGYPQRAVLESDMRERRLYLCGENGALCAAFVFYMGPEPAYEALDGAWLRAGPYGVVHRITSDGTVKGAATYCLNWAFQQCRNLKIDTHRENLIMQHLLKKNGFSQCGIIYTDDGTERLAYQKE